MPKTYILKFVKTWGKYKAGDYKITTSKTTRDALVETYGVAVEADEPKVATPLRTLAQVAQPTPEKSPNLADPCPKGETRSSEFVKPRGRRGR
jgi:hypothetical protein